MSIFNRKYEPYDGPLESLSARFLVITTTELRRLTREKWVRRLFIGAWVPVIFLTGMLYVNLIMKQATGWDGLGGDIYLYLFRTEVWFVALMLAAFGASLINRDQNSRALTLYFTRPIGADQYLWGKLLSIGAVVLSVTLVPGVLLALAQLLMSETAQLGRFFDMTARVALCSVAIAFMSANLILLLSSLARSSRFVGTLWLGLFVLLEIVRSVLESQLGTHDLLDLISIGRLFNASAEFLFQGDERKLPALVALFVFGGFFFVSLRTRVKQLEKQFT